jgi:3-keto-disaccharide hydrolase
MSTPLSRREFMWVAGATGAAAVVDLAAANDVENWILTARQAAPAATGHNSLTDAEKRAGWVLLFDGAALDGWRGYNRPDAAGTRWKVEDGFLTVGPAEGRDTRGALDLITTSAYDQFDLTFEWRVAPGGNSGVKYFVLEDRDAAIGHEYQIIDDARHKDAQVGPDRQTASFYDVLAAANRTLRPAGELNQSRITVRGRTVEHWLNGASVLQYELGSASLQSAIDASKFKGIERFGKLQSGHILLQDHGDQVWYRNLKIQRLGS